MIEEASSAEKERYRLLLQAALGGGVVQPADKEKLALYREMHAIPLEEHNQLLFEQGWKEEEFEVGFHKDIASSHFQQYAALVKKELAKGKVRCASRQWSSRAVQQYSCSGREKRICSCEDDGNSHHGFGIGLCCSTSAHPLLVLVLVLLVPLALVQLLMTPFLVRCGSFVCSAVRPVATRHDTHTTGIRAVQV